MKEHKRRSLLAVPAVLVAATPRTTRAQAGQFRPLMNVRMTGIIPASCAALRQFDDRLRQEAERSARMSPQEVATEVEGIFAALRRREAAVAQTNAALASGRLELARAAMSSVVDIVLASCIAVQSPQCIGTTYGIKIIAEGVQSTIQAMEAHDGKDVGWVLFGYAAGRASLLKDLASDLKPKPVHENGRRTMKLLAEAGMKLSEAGAQVASARRELEAAASSLQEFQRAFDRAFVNDQTYRQYRREHYEAQRWLPQLLLRYHSSRGCIPPEAPSGVMP